MFTPYTPSLRHHSLTQGGGRGPFTRIRRKDETARACLFFSPWQGLVPTSTIRRGQFILTLFSGKNFLTHWGQFLDPTKLFQRHRTHNQQPQE